jgi:hypothetical protein
MARFYGQVGYGETVEATPESGVWEDKITEIPYYGDVIRNSRNLESGDKANPDITVDNRISIVADQYAIEHFFNIKYVRWAGVPWTVTNVEVQRPRLILQLGSVYNGPTTDIVVTAASASNMKGDLE